MISTNIKTNTYMKKLLFLLFISNAAIAQDEQPQWQDSTITIQATQRLAWWAANSIDLSWDNRKAPDAFRLAVGSGTRPDSVFTVTIRAGLLQRTLENLLTKPLLLVYNDYRSIILNQPSIPGYTRLDTQIITQANQGRGAAIWLRDWYNSRVSQFTAAYDEEKARILKIVQ
jgi:hypothetical protein